MPYIKIPLNRVVSVEKIISVYKYSFDKNYAYSGESHDFWELIYVEDGRLLVSSGDTTYNMQLGDILFHRPGDFHSVRCDGSGSARVVIISFDSHSAAVDVLGDGKTGVPIELRDRIGAILSEADSCFEIGTSPLEPKADAPIGAEQILRSELESFIIRLIRLRADKTDDRFLFTSRDELERRLAEDIVGYLRENVTGRVTLDDVCSRFHFGKSHICHIFKSRTGTTIVRSLIDMKLERAREMLSSGAYNVSETSEALGFDSPQYFSKLFRRNVGVPPSALIPR